MTNSLITSDVAHGREDVAARLLDSTAQMSFDPETDIDWDAPLDPDLYGLNPEWSTLYGTAMWDEMSQAQRVLLTRHEVASVMCTAIWFEVILQQMVLRDQYCKDPTGSEFQYALTEIADECRHSTMFARACTAMGIPGYVPNIGSRELGRFFKALAYGELAYGAILVAEEVFDMMQRDWMRGENVLPLVRMTSKIHVVEESRHMTFARDMLKKRIANKTIQQKDVYGFIISIAANVIVKNLVHKRVYAAAGLDTKRAVREAKNNQHHHAMMRSSSENLMAFIREAGLMSPASAAIYRRLHML